MTMLRSYPTRWVHLLVKALLYNHKASCLYHFDDSDLLMVIFLVSTSLQAFEDLNERKQILDILQIVLKQAGFLVDKTALKLIERHTEDDQNLVCLDNVFSALGISNWNDVRKLKEKFEEVMKSRYRCTNDSFTKSDESCASQSDQTEDQIKVQVYL